MFIMYSGSRLCNDLGFVFFQYGPMTLSLLLGEQSRLLCFLSTAACLLFLGVGKAAVGSSTTVAAVSLIYISILLHKD